MAAGPEFDEMAGELTDRLYAPEFHKVLEWGQKAKPHLVLIKTLLRVSGYMLVLRSRIYPYSP